MQNGDGANDPAIKEALAESHNKIGNIFSVRFYENMRDTGPLSLARGEYEKALKNLTELVNAHPAEARFNRLRAQTIANIAGVLIELKDYAEARRFQKERIDIDAKLYASDPGNIYWRKALAAGYYNQALQCRGSGPMRDPKTALESARMATILSQERNLEHLKLYKSLVTDAAEKARIEELLARMREKPLEALEEGEAENASGAPVPALPPKTPATPAKPEKPRRHPKR